MTGPTYVMRAAGPKDIEGFLQLREIAGAGFTSLMLDDAQMLKKLELSRRRVSPRTPIRSAVSVTSSRLNTSKPERSPVAAV